MKYITYADYFEVNGKIWAINSKPSGCYTHMLKSMIGQIDNMLEHHSKVLVVRFDLRCIGYHETNQIISEFNRQLFSKLKSGYGFTRIGFMWVRELEKAKQQHYHYALLLNGNSIQHPAKVLSHVEAIWLGLAGTYWIPEHCYYRINRGNHTEQQDVVNRISYFAKGRGKGYRPPQTKDYSTSRIKPPKHACRP